MNFQEKSIREPPLGRCEVGPRLPPLSLGSLARHPAAAPECCGLTKKQAAPKMTSEAALLRV